jgi:hypothetical protein
MKYFFICLMLFWLCSCKTIHRKIFSPTQINNPFLQKKNDHSFSVSYSLPSGFDVSGGLAITNRLAIIGGAYTYKNRDKETQQFIFSRPDNDATALLFYRHKGFHGGLGIYFPVSKKSTANFVSFFGGYTIGSFRMDERYFDNSTTSSVPSKISFYKSDISRYFLQGSLNLYGKNAEVSFISRYNYVGYGNVNTDYTTDEQRSYNLPPIYPRFSQFLDIAFDAKFFLEEHPQFGLQFFGSITPRIHRRDYDFYHYAFRAGIGIVVKNPFTTNSKN